MMRQIVSILVLLFTTTAWAQEDYLKWSSFPYHVKEELRKFRSFRSGEYGEYNKLVELFRESAAPCSFFEKNVLNDIRASSAREFLKFEVSFVGQNPQDVTKWLYLYIGSSNADNTRITIRLDFLRCLPSLKALEFRWMDIPDFSPISSLTQLEHLSIEGTKLKNVEPLRNLLKLRTVVLPANRLHDVVDLVPLIFLNSLDISENPEVKNILGVSALSELTDIKVGGDKISNLEPLSHLPLLKSISAAYNNIETMDTLKNLPSLKILNLTGNCIARFPETLNEFPSLAELRLDFNEISALQPEIISESLDTLNLSANELSSYEEIASWYTPKLKRISMDGHVNPDNVQKATINGIRISLEPMLSLNLKMDVLTRCKMVREGR